MLDPNGEYTEVRIPSTKPTVINQSNYVDLYLNVGENKPDPLFPNAFMPSMKTKPTPIESTPASNWSEN